MAEFVQSEMTVIEIGKAIFNSPESLESRWDEYCNIKKDDRHCIKELVNDHDRINRVFMEE